MTRSKAVDRRRLHRQYACASITDPPEREAIARVLRGLVRVEA